MSFGSTQNPMHHKLPLKRVTFTKNVTTDFGVWKTIYVKRSKCKSMYLEYTLASGEGRVPLWVHINEESFKADLLESYCVDKELARLEGHRARVAMVATMYGGWASGLIGRGAQTDEQRAEEDRKREEDKEKRLRAYEILQEIDEHHGPLPDPSLVDRLLKLDPTKDPPQETLWDKINED